MINLFTYFIDNAIGTRYERIWNEILKYDNDAENFNYLDDYEIIEQYKECLQPENADDNKYVFEFYLLSFYLYNENYKIKQLPQVLKSPTELNKVSYYKIRSILFNKGLNEGSTIRHETRRRFISGLVFEKSTFDTSEQVKSMLEDVSHFDIKILNDKTKPICIRALNESIENILKEGKKYKKFDEEAIFLSLITNDFVKKYRSLTHCFRHGEESQLRKREKLKPHYDFLIRQGITILEELVKLNEK